MRRDDKPATTTIAISGGIRSAWAAYQACVAHRGTVTLVHVSHASRDGLRSDRACDLLVARLRAQFGDRVQYTHYQINATPGAPVPQPIDLIRVFAPDAQTRHTSLDARQLVAWLGRDVMALDYCVSPPDCGACDDCRTVRAAIGED